MKNTLAACLVLAFLVVVKADEAKPDARAVLEQTGKRGLCVVLGDTQGTFAVDLAKRSELLVYVQAAEAKQVDTIRKAAEDAGLLGSRIFVQRGPLAQLHLADNLADAIVVQGDAVKGSKREDLLRVLRPGGKVLGLDRELTKAAPKDVDEWTHPYHGPDNNPQSRDKVARAPYLTHFTAEPWYCPMPLVTVASGGRLFKAFGHLAVKEREWPYLNTLIAQNAYNGAILWKRPLAEGFMIHRNTIIATPAALYIGDNQSCKVIDTATGEVKDEIALPRDLGDGPAWKWMALVDGVLYALVGKEEPPDPTLKGGRQARGWPWRGGALGQGYDSKTYPWGFGNTILAMDVSTKKVLWKHQEKERLDSRATCMAGNRIFFSSHGNFLGALETQKGAVLWKTTDAEVLKAIGEDKFAQNPNEGFSSSAYVKCNDQAIYFAGPTRASLAAVSTKDGKLLWQAKDRGNSQLVLRDDGLYAMSPGASTRFDYLTGKVLANLGPRVNCTRATGSADSIFVRGGRDGTIRYDIEGNKQQHLCPMRPSCQDGVIPAYGHLYWGPWMCDCNLTLVGVISLAPAGDIKYPTSPDDSHRYERAGYYLDKVDKLSEDESDWPTLRANNQRTAYVPVTIPEKSSLGWTYVPKTALPATGAIAVGGMLFTGSTDGAVRALDAATGELKWKVHTAAAISYPPSLHNGRLYVGSGDGWFYCFEAKTGKQMWRFRAAPMERTIPVYGSLRSTWPVASGVVVGGDGAVYAAAGMANHDGTHVLCVDEVTGHLRWHNKVSGAIDPKTGGGVSVNGHMLVHNKTLYLAGGNVVPVAAYRMRDGECLSDPKAPASHTSFRAGSDLYLEGDEVVAGGSPLYSTRGDYRMVEKAVLDTPAGKVLTQLGLHNSIVGLIEAGAKPGTKPLWTQKTVSRVLAVAVTKNAVVIAGTHDPIKKGDAPTSSVLALRLKDGEVLWQHRLPAAPSSWGLAVERGGRILVSLDDGRVLAYGASCD